MTNLKGRPAIPLEIGKKYGRLMPIECLGVYDTHLQYRFICDCGSIVVKWASVVRRSKIVSCGCRLKEVYLEQTEKRQLPPGESIRHCIFANYQCNSLSLRREFALTYEEFKTITSSVCQYCGASPKPITRSKRHGTCYFTGIDRHDNSKGYTTSNCGPACETCNRIKGTMNRDEFLHLMETIYEIHCG